MNRDNFLAALRSGLAGLPAQDIEDILADYRTHFADGESAGRSEDDVAAAMGDPARLARELKAETRLRRWEKKRSAGNFIAVLFALIGLATLDVLLLAPLICALAFVVMIGGIVLFALLLAGIGVLFAFPWTLFAGFHLAMTTGLAALGLLSGAIGGGELLLLVIDGTGKLLARYARLHYRLVDSTSPNP
jgi:uncharacterized membrane protein